MAGPYGSNVPEQDSPDRAANKKRGIAFDVNFDDAAQKE